MSMLDVNFKSGASATLVDKILEQGQRLRNSMVQAVLNNDPFNQEILTNANALQNSINDKKNVNSLRCTCGVSNKKYPDLNEGIDRYLNQESLFLNQELEALETRRTVSPVNMKQSTSSLKGCHCKNSCDICKEYENKLCYQSSSASPRSSTDSVVVTKQCKTCQSKHEYSQRTARTLNLCDKNSKLKPTLIEEKPAKLKPVKNTVHENQTLLKYVDSLKINIYSLKLNNAGYRKVMASECVDKIYMLNANNSYFIEYTLPEFLIKNIPKTRARINTGLNPDKKIRYCTKRMNGDSVYFRQQAIHPVSNVNMLDLTNIKIIFNISFRSIKQRIALLIGKASFNLGSLIANRFLSCEQELVIMNENAPVALGTVKVALQFGCDKLYFGKEFIDAISCSKENSNLSETDSIHKLETSIPVVNKLKSKAENKLSNLYHNILQYQETINTNDTFREKAETNLDNKIEEKSYRDYRYEETNLLYALIFISEVRVLSDPVDSYLICRGFSRDDTITSRTIYNDCKPVFNLYQTIPILLDQEFVNRFRDNYIIVEVWEQQEHDQLIGLCKLSLHQLYIAYRNSAIVKHLARSPHPVIAVDWWEPINNPISNLETGQLRGLVALGTRIQIENLEQTRNIKNFYEKPPIFKAKSVTTSEKCNNTPINTPNNTPRSDVHITRQPSVKRVSIKIDNEGETVPSKKISPKTILKEKKSVQILEPKIPVENITEAKSGEPISNKVDACTQSDSKMDSNRSDRKTPPAFNAAQISQRELLNCFFEQLISNREISQRTRHVESSTNTEECLISSNTKNSTSEVPTPSTVVVTTQNQQPTITNKATKDTISVGSINNSTNNSINNTSHLLNSLEKALSIENRTEETDLIDIKVSDKFKAHVVIESALHLPSRKKCKSKKSKMKHSKNEEILPSAYVTFKGFSDTDIVVTPVIPKSTSPRWDYRMDIFLPTELLINNQKRLIFKVWRKANGPNLQPNFQTDIVLGFAALDLTVLLSGLPNVQGWFNIVDFSSKCNGQIKIHVTPLENLLKFNDYKRSYIPEKLCSTSANQSRNATTSNKSSIQQDVPLNTPCTSVEGVPSEELSRALKRKFTELDEITQRLRQRLSTVTNDFELANDDIVQEFERDLNTVCAQEDEDKFKLISEHENAGPSCSSNNPTTEVLFKSTNFEEANINPSVDNATSRSNVATSRSNMTTARTNTTAISNTTSILSALNAAKRISGSDVSNLSSNPSDNNSCTDSEGTQSTVQDNLLKLDNHLMEGKIKIDSLLEKLSLLTGSDIEPPQTKTKLSFTSRYVSGCSDSNNSNVNSSQVLRDIGIEHQDKVDADLIFNPLLFQQMYTNSAESTPRIDNMTSVQCTTLKSLVTELPSSASSGDLQSVSSGSTNVSRQAPEGAGNQSNESPH